MSKFLQSLRQRTLLIVFLIFYLIFCLLTYKDYGISFDENNVYLRGKLFYFKIKGQDPVLKRDCITPNDNNQLPYYNYIYPAILYAINDNESYEIYHLLNLLVGTLVFIFAYEILLFFYRRQTLAIIGPIFLFFTPQLFGHIPINPKDTPFAIAYLFSLAAILFTRKTDDKKRILILGISFGITQSLRIVGYVIYIVFILAQFVFLFHDLKTERTLLSRIFSLIIEVFLIFCVGFLIHVLTMPYLGVDPFNHFLELLKLGKKFPWEGQVLLLGREYLSTNLPWFYLPVWYLFTLPIFIEILFFVGFIFSEWRSALKQLFVISLITNIGIYILSKPVIYDGARHFTYLLPQIIIFAVLGLIFLLKHLKKNYKAIVIAGITVCLLRVGYYYFEIHPYEYIYFNDLIGGLKGAQGKFDLDYWNTANKEAVEWIKKNINQSKKTLKIAICGQPFSAKYYFSDNMILELDWPKADYVICWDRFGDNRKIKGIEINSIKRQGVALVYIYKIIH